MKIKKIEIDKLLIIKYIFYSNIGGNVEFFKNNNIKLYQDDIYKMAYSNDEKLLEYLSYILGRRNIKTINIEELREVLRCISFRTPLQEEYEDKLIKYLENKSSYNEDKDYPLADKLISVRGYYWVLYIVFL